MELRKEGKKKLGKGRLAIVSVCVCMQLGVRVCMPEDGDLWSPLSFPTWFLSVSLPKLSLIPTPQAVIYQALAIHLCLLFTS